MTDLDQAPVEAQAHGQAEEPDEAQADARSEAGTSGGARYINRELSWLDFDARVLALAEDQTLPLLERVKFLAIFSANLDEFYQVRVAGLKRQADAGVATRSADGSTATEQLTSITARVGSLTQTQGRVFLNDIKPKMDEAGIHLVRWEELDGDQRSALDAMFMQQIFPVVTPLAVDPAHPFPYISNLSLNLAVTVADPFDGRTRFARVKVPPLLPRFLEIARHVFVPLEDVIAANLDLLFPGMTIEEHFVFRVTRNTDFLMEDDEAEDLLEALEEELSRRRISPVVRLETQGSIPDHILDLLVREMQIDREDVQCVPGMLGLGDLWQLHQLDRPDLKDPPNQPLTHPALATHDDSDPDLFAVLREQNVLVHHPYESFRTSAQRFIEQAATDPHVLAIKQTLYRTSGESPIVDALVDAARSGKQVVVLVEIKARFDEIANINWARALEQAGCHVVYGLVGLKTHCKLCLVVRREPNGLQRYVHVGTGNYNPRTAAIYEDLGLLTSDPQVGADVSDLFNYLTGYSRQTDYRTLVVAPYGMREAIISMIDREAKTAEEGGPGRIIIKANALVDEAIIDALYSASRAGVQVDLIVRGICALRPGVPGLSENIKVRSILGRYLEHSRILYFENGGAQEIFIGSADLMHRNLDRRVEVFVRVGPEDIRKELGALLELALADNRSAWELRSEGTWTPVQARDDQPRLVLQEELTRRAVHA